MNKVTKSTSILAATLLLCMTLLISACSSAPNEANSNTGGNSAQSTSTSTSQQADKETSNTSIATGTTKTYTDGRGTVTIPTDPKRIVDLTGSAIGNLLVLGVKPVAATQNSLVNPYHEGKLDGIINIGEEPNIEAILDLEPDLIIAFDYIEEAQYEQLAQIAPVVRLKYGAGTPSELLMEFGKITGKEAVKSYMTTWA